MGRADVSVRDEWQQGMPSAGIALSIKPTILFLLVYHRTRRAHEHAKCLIWPQRGSAAHGLLIRERTQAARWDAAVLHGLGGVGDHQLFHQG
jgi:hypothetical protein